MWKTDRAIQEKAEGMIPVNGLDLPVSF